MLHAEHFKTLVRPPVVRKYTQIGSGCWCQRVRIPFPDNTVGIGLTAHKWRWHVTDLDATFGPSANNVNLVFWHEIHRTYNIRHNERGHQFRLIKYIQMDKLECGISIFDFIYHQVSFAS